MKIHPSRIVTNEFSDDQKVVIICPIDRKPTFHAPQMITIYNKNDEANKMRVWTCENHRLPDHITDKED